jgi:hypothetical protein
MLLCTREPQALCRCHRKQQVQIGGEPQALCRCHRKQQVQIGGEPQALCRCHRKQQVQIGGFSFFSFVCDLCVCDQRPPPTAINPPSTTHHPPLSTHHPLPTHSLHFARSLDHSQLHPPLLLALCEVLNFPPSRSRSHSARLQRVLAGLWTCASPLRSSARWPWR